MDDNNRRSADPKNLPDPRNAWENFSGQLGQKLKTYFFAGVLVAAPFCITIYIAYSIVQFVDERITPLFPQQWQMDGYLPFNIPGLGLVVLLVGLTAIGAVTTNFMGQFLVNAGDRILAHLPIIRSLYSPLKQTAEMLFGTKKQAFRQVVMVPYPDENSYAIGFLSGETPAFINHAEGQNLVAVFIPFSPVPTAGFLLYFRPEQVKFIDLPVEDAWKLVLSTGLVAGNNQPEPK